MSEYPHTCPRCQSPAYVGLKQVDCSNPTCGKSTHELLYGSDKENEEACQKLADQLVDAHRPTLTGGSLHALDFSDMLVKKIDDDQNDIDAPLHVRQAVKDRSCLRYWVRMALGMMPLGGRWASRRGLGDHCYAKHDNCINMPVSDIIEEWVKEEVRAKKDPKEPS